MAQAQEAGDFEFIKKARRKIKVLDQLIEAAPARANLKLLKRLEAEKDVAQANRDYARCKILQQRINILHGGDDFAGKIPHLWHKKPGERASIDALFGQMKSFGTSGTDARSVSESEILLSTEADFRIPVNAEEVADINKRRVKEALGLNERKPDTGMRLTTVKIFYEGFVNVADVLTGHLESITRPADKLVKVGKYNVSRLTPSELHRFWVAFLGAEEKVNCQVTNHDGTKSLDMVVYRADLIEQGILNFIYGYPTTTGKGFEDQLKPGCKLVALDGENLKGVTQREFYEIACGHKTTDIIFMGSRRMISYCQKINIKISHLKTANLLRFGDGDFPKFNHCRQLHPFIAKGDELLKLTPNRTTHGWNLREFLEEIFMVEKGGETITPKINLRLLASPDVLRLNKTTGRLIFTGVPGKFDNWEVRQGAQLLMAGGEDLSVVDIFKMRKLRQKWLNITKPVQCLIKRKQETRKQVKIYTRRVAILHDLVVPKHELMNIQGLLSFDEKFQGQFVCPRFTDAVEDVPELGDDCSRNMAAHGERKTHAGSHSQATHRVPRRNSQRKSAHLCAGRSGKEGSRVPRPGTTRRLRCPGEPPRLR